MLLALCLLSGCSRQQAIEYKTLYYGSELAIEADFEMVMLGETSILLSGQEFEKLLQANNKLEKSIVAQYDRESIKLLMQFRGEGNSVPLYSPYKIIRNGMNLNVSLSGGITIVLEDIDNQSGDCAWVFIAELSQKISSTEFTVSESIDIVE